MTYLKQSNYKIRKHIENIYTIEELENFVNETITRYANYIEKIYQFKKERDEAIKNLTFPFSTYRKGQKELMDFVKQSSIEKREVYVEAPTGIGKTISVLFPLMKRFKINYLNRIYYLTNKNSIKKIAINTLAMLDKLSQKVKAIELTSKENICFNDKKGHCNPIECPFAKNYYDKLLEATLDALNSRNIFSRDSIENFCYKKNMCPYQFQLDLASYCDVLVCDYSYVFDYHDRLGLEESGFKNTHSVLCIDECHNLPDRVRDMHSIYLDMHNLSDALSLCSGKEFIHLKEDINNLIDNILARKFDKNDQNVKLHNLFIEEKVPASISNTMQEIIDDIKDLIKKQTHLVTDDLLDFFILLILFIIYLHY